MIVEGGEVAGTLAPLIWLLPVGLGFLAGVIGTGWVRRHALRLNLYDYPGHRSLHDRPVLRGGGLAIAITIIAAVLILTLVGYLSSKVSVALLPAAILIAAIGWLDDRRGLPAGIRAVSYLLAVIWFVVWLGTPPEIDLGAVKMQTTPAVMPEAGVLVIPQWLLSLLLILGMTWLTNLYNFMDGADGLAGLQAVLAGIAGAMMFWQQGTDSLVMLCLVISAVSAGFLIWNWPPASIFMGDSGSCLLGFIFASLAVLGEVLADLPMLLWVILLAAFFWDASLTLLMRMLKRERWYTAHRSHAYQRLVQTGFSHGQLVWLFLAYNVLVLWPLAWWGYTQPAFLPMAVTLSALLTGLLWLAIQLYYGKRISGDTDFVQS